MSERCCYKILLSWALLAFTAFVVLAVWRACEGRTIAWLHGSLAFGEALCACTFGWLLQITAKS